MGAGLAFGIYMLHVEHADEEKKKGRQLLQSCFSSLFATLGSVFAFRLFLLPFVKSDTPPVNVPPRLRRKRKVAAMPRFKFGEQRESLRSRAFPPRNCSVQINGGGGS